MPEMLRPHEALVIGFQLAGEDEANAERLARTALGALVAVGYVLKVRGGDIVRDDD